MNPPGPGHGRAGHALMELVVALPILAIGGAAVAGILLTSGGLLLEADRRLEAASLGTALLDSLSRASPDAPAQGSLAVLDRDMAWRWDGQGTLEIDVGVAMAPAEGSDEGGGSTGGATPGGTWVLRAHGSPDA